MTAFDEGRLHDVARAALAACPADEAEAVILAEDGALTRFAENHIHQNVRERNVELRVRAVVGRRVGVAATNDLGPGAVAEVARRAAVLAAGQPPALAWPGLAETSPAGHVPPPDAATLAATPAERAAGVAPLCRAAQAAGAQASGALATACQVTAVGTSHGLWAYEARSRAEWIAVVLFGSGAGYAQRSVRALGNLDPEALGAEALDKASTSREPIALDPGTYEVVLEPYAVGTLLSFLGVLGLNGRAILEGRSFLSDARGEPVASPSITLRDDPNHPLTIAETFDCEGTPTAPLVCIDAGVAREGVWDRETAARAGRASTGHALPAPNGWGPHARHLVLDPGTTPLAEMVAATRRGVLVTRFNYVRTVMPRQTVITGLTRDGTFLIEDGRVTAPVRNLRFTQGILEALSDVRAVGDTLLPVGEHWPCAAPALHLGSFMFSGATTY